jgi:methylated-DNA-protein-cysteine methyltransferase-like protein
MPKQLKNHPKKNDSFFDSVYWVTKQIPPGRVSSYGAIARCIGSAGASRMVGWALNHCHNSEETIPAHRVVNRNGLLTGKAHFRHPKLMQELLENEGIKIENDRVLDFQSLFWDPSSYLV